jgi:hypothetical protein
MRPVVLGIAGERDLPHHFRAQAFPNINRAGASSRSPCEPALSAGARSRAGASMRQFGALSIRSKLIGVLSLFIAGMVGLGLFDLHSVRTIHGRRARRRPPS